MACSDAVPARNVLSHPGAARPRLACRQFFLCRQRICRLPRGGKAELSALAIPGATRVSPVSALDSDLAGFSGCGGDRSRPAGAPFAGIFCLFADAAADGRLTVL